MIRQSNIGTQIEIDEFTNINELVGRNFSNLSYEMRVLFHQNLTPEEIRQLKTNRTTPELLDKGQSIIDAYYSEKNPTPEQLIERRMNEWNRQQIDDIGKLLFKDAQRLKNLDDMVANDEPVPVGERKRIRENIQMNKDLLTKLGVNPDAVIERTEFINSPFQKQHEMKTNNPAEYDRIMNLQPVNNNKVSEGVQKLASDMGFDVDAFVDGFNNGSSDGE